MIRLLIVDPARLMCNLVATVLKSQADIQVMGMVQEVTAALEPAGNCDVVLVSAQLPEGGAFELIHRLKSHGVKVVITGLVESQPLILSYVEAGAAGYVLRDSSADELISTIRAVHRGEAPVSPAVGMALVERMKELLALSKRIQLEPVMTTASSGKLSEREKTVLALIADGLTNQEIAQTLIIELGTVKNHVHSILKKLNVSSRAQAARCYLSGAPNSSPLEATDPIRVQQADLQLRYRG